MAGLQYPFLKIDFRALGVYTILQYSHYHTFAEECGTVLNSYTMVQYLCGKHLSFSALKTDANVRKP